MPDRPYFFDLDPDGLEEIVRSLGLPAYRAKQILEWVFAHGVVDPGAMTSLSRGDRSLLAERFRFTAGDVVRHQVASDGVEKLLIDWNGAGGSTSDATAECVLIPSPPRRTACVSSQIGCPVGCTFCASGLGGLDGNLSAGRIVEQVWRLGRLTDAGRVSHVVFMGMGEPLANFEQVAKAMNMLTADWGLDLSARHITVSTVGLPAQIRRLAGLGLPVTLAISLHAPDDELRRELIPWAEFVSIDQLVEAGRDYFRQTGREVTLEYILLRDVNDRPEHARRLQGVARRLRSNVNLIRYNEVEPLRFRRPTDEAVHAFQNVLREGGINVHIRASRGRDIAAACGQLRARG